MLKARGQRKLSCIDYLNRTLTKSVHFRGDYYNPIALMIHLCSAARESTLQTVRRKCWDAQGLRILERTLSGRVSFGHLQFDYFFFHLFVNMKVNASHGRCFCISAFSSVKAVIAMWLSGYWRICLSGCQQEAVKNLFQFSYLWSLLD